MLQTVLIANRGEIACRIARTCRAMGVRTVAVYSEADADAMHVHACDEAWPVGPAPAKESYLNVDRILEVARRSGADGIHPGYGFLSENAEFAEACTRAGIRFIGPPASAIRAMGSKSAAKTIMADAGVPLVPGYHGDDQTPEHLAKVADEIGYPVLIKASAGGGGKGMRRVDDPADFAEALTSARREAAAGFGDDTVLLEKYLLQPRHVEVQVFADDHGNVVHLFERDCSVQRRHQKVIEEAPAPGLSDEKRRAMGDAAVAAARAIGYVGAGTVEFIMDAHGAFFFMEMNTRLQVEHPVTEMITGEDLVAWQLQVAAGQPLPRNQDTLAFSGHAFEARIYAEDPDRDFLPAIGTVSRLRTPAEDDHVRIDTGIREGDAISIHYDPMIAKLVVWDDDRDKALQRLRNALAGWTVAGTTTNTRFLGRIAAHPAFARGGVDTGFIEQYQDDLFPAAHPVPDPLLAVAALYELLSVDQAAAERSRASGDPWSPWHSTDGWQPNSDNHHVLHFLDGDTDLTVVAHYRHDCFLLDLPRGTVTANGTLGSDGHMRLVLDGVHQDALALQSGDQLSVAIGGAERRLVIHDPLSAGMSEELREGSLTAPMPGSVLQVMVVEGDHVEEGAALMVLEAMKMEHTIRAFTSGRVDKVNFRQGDQVSEGAELLTIGAEE
ncbi:acetyl/propionyl/methylcrotonyl-CoA carboxylase subunit alpha [Aquisalimonas sp.]|uniref:acetyl-CoA carboxylase biotin carboxylase subunit n=1 Tax=unclassified Aquisalimonas TaxID=2644645 RepID=UPI0025BDB7F4|nr:acetyl/propionyl/methylcrotonyl-CoA carboxylase subunit alpha [Aquisalimonas sp.]